MPRSVPDDDIVENQQAADRRPVKPQPMVQEDPAAEASRRAAVEEANLSMNERARGRTGYDDAAAEEIEHDTRANRGLGALFGLFRRSRGRKKMEETVDSALGSKK